MDWRFGIIVRVGIPVPTETLESEFPNLSVIVTVKVYVESLSMSDKALIAAAVLVEFVLPVLKEIAEPFFFVYVPVKV